MRGGSRGERRRPFVKLASRHLAWDAWPPEDKADAAQLVEHAATSLDQLIRKWPPGKWEAGATLKEILEAGP